MTRAAAVLAVGLLLAGVASAAAQGLSVSSLSPPATQGDISAAMQAMPLPATTTPPATALDGASGGSVQYARADHTHAVKVQRTRVETLSDGTATWSFVRPIILPTGRLPVIANMVEAAGLPITVQVTGWASTTDGSTTTFTAVTVQAQQARALPGLLLNLSALLNYVVFQNAGAGVRVHLWAADPTQ